MLLLVCGFKEIVMPWVSFGYQSYLECSRSHSSLLSISLKPLLCGDSGPFLWLSPIDLTRHTNLPYKSGNVRYLIDSGFS